MYRLTTHSPPPLRVSLSILVIAFTLLVSPDLLAGTTPESRVTALTRDGVALRNDGTASPAELARFIDEYVDVAHIARRAVGKRWNGVDAELRTSIVDALRVALSGAVASAFEDVSTDSMRILRARTRDDAAVVSTKVRKGNSPTNVDYRLRRGDGGWKVTDVIVSGVSMAQLYRMSLAPVIEREGVAALVDTLTLWAERAAERRLAEG